MPHAIAWTLCLLGAAHIAYGLLKFRRPLVDAVGAGFVGQFKAPDARRAALWFVLFGPMLMLAGHAAVHAVARGDLGLLTIIGGYLLAVSLVGWAAMPKSPFIAGLPSSVALLAVSCGWVS
jgi:Family of unknown function (DUF6463)